MARTLDGGMSMCRTSKRLDVARGVYLGDVE
jgi:hypothetical protein